MAQCFALRVTCRDCGNHQDVYGCFDGESELLAERYATRVAAETARRDLEAAERNPWDYSVEEVELQFSDLEYAAAQARAEGEAWARAGHDYHVGVAAGVKEAFRMLGQVEDVRAMICRQRLQVQRPCSSRPHPPCPGNSPKAGHPCSIRR